MIDPVLLSMLEDHEGRRRLVYRCPAGKLTIGVGRNLEDVGLSEDEIDYLLRNDVKRCERELDRYVPFWRKLSPARQRVLVDMHFNLGQTKLSRFVKFLDAMKRANYELAAVEMLDSKWAADVGTRATALATMMRRG